MNRHNIYGVEAPELGWVPMPRYLLRRDRVLHHLGRGHGRKLLEIGCGAGALLADLSARGFDCTGLETSVKAREIACAINAGSSATRIVAEPQHGWANSFDVVISLEVLEHIHEDQDAMAQWRRWLKPGGTFMASVPCHMSKWGPSDEWAGHVRRYEEDEFRSLMTSNDLEVMHFETYGYPLLRAVDALRRRHYVSALHARPRNGVQDLAQSTAESGVDRHELGRFYKLSKTAAGVAMMMGAMQLQKAFLRSRLGDGFLIVARGIS